MRGGMSEFANMVKRLLRAKFIQLEQQHVRRTGPLPSGNQVVPAARHDFFKGLPCRFVPTVNRHRNQATHTSYSPQFDELFDETGDRRQNGPIRRPSASRIALEDVAQNRRRNQMVRRALHIGDPRFGIAHDRNGTGWRIAVVGLVHRHEYVPVTVAVLLGVVEIDQVWKRAGDVTVDEIKRVAGRCARRGVGPVSHSIDDGVSQRIGIGRRGSNVCQAEQAMGVPSLG